MSPEIFNFAATQPCHELLWLCQGQKENSVFRNIAKEGGSWSLVKPEDSFLSDCLLEAVPSALVHGGESLHFHFYGVQGLAAVDAGNSALWREV